MWLKRIGCQLSFFALSRAQEGALAQLVRALPCHGRGCGFEPRRLRGFLPGNGDIGMDFHDGFMTKKFMLSPRCCGHSYRFRYGSMADTFAVLQQSAALYAAAASSIY